MSKSLPSCCLILQIVLLLSLVPVAAFAQTLELVVLEGDAAPGTGGGTLSAFGPPSINDDGDVAFLGTTSLPGGGSGFGVFVDDDGVLSELALTGSVAPDSGGGLFAGFFDPVINSAGQVAFVATWTGGTLPPPGLFLYTPGVGLSALAIGGQLAPDSGGGTYISFGNGIGLTDAGEAIATTSVFGGSFNSALYGFTTSTARVILATGDAAPPPLAGTYFQLFSPTVSPDGDIAMFVFFSAGFTLGVLHIDPLGNDTAVALQGSLAPDTGGGTYNSFALDRPGVNDDGDVGFHASISGGTSNNGLFLTDGVVSSSLVLDGDVAPDTGGAIYDDPIDSPSLDASGRAAFRSDLFPNTAGEGLFLSALGTDASIAVTGDTAPGVPGATFDAFPTTPAQSPAGRIAFDATLVGAAATSGIWTLPEPSVGAALAVGTLLLGVAGRARGRRTDAP